MAGDKLKCPNCGAKVYATDDRCVSCGTMLDAGQLVAIPDPEEATREGEVEPEPSAAPQPTPRVVLEGTRRSASGLRAKAGVWFAVALASAAALAVMWQLLWCFYSVVTNTPLQVDAVEDWGLFVHAPWEEGEISANPWSAEWWMALVWGLLMGVWPVFLLWIWRRSKQLERATAEEPGPAGEEVAHAARAPTTDWEQGRGYVKRLRQKGRTDEQIRQIMLKGAWTEEQVERLFAREAPPPAAPQSPPSPRPDAREVVAPPEAGAETQKKADTTGRGQRGGTSRRRGMSCVTLASIICLALPIVMFMCFLGLCAIIEQQEVGGAAAGELLFPILIVMAHAAAFSMLVGLVLGLVAILQRCARRRAPLHWAAREGDAEAARRLLEAGADVNAAGKKGRTPLHRAASGAHAEVAVLLVEHGANVNATDNKGQTPLAVAHQYGHTKVADLLRQRGAQEAEEGAASRALCSPMRGFLLAVAHLIAGLSRTGARVGSFAWRRATEDKPLFGKLAVGVVVVSVAALVCFPAAERRWHFRSVAYYERVQDVDVLLDKAANGNRWTRSDAARALGEVYDGEDERVVRALIKALDDREPDVICSAAWALKQIGGRSAIAPLGEALKHRDPSVRAAAAEALGGVRDERAKSLLATAADDPDSAVRQAVQESLRSISYQETQRDGLSAGPGAERFVRQALAAKQRGDLTLAAIMLRSAIQMDAGNVDAHWALAWVLVDQGHKDDAIEEFRQVRKLASDARVRREATEAMARLSK